MPDWIPLACYTAIAAGTLSGGWKIVKNMGSDYKSNFILKV
jgi:PiT family inorganic phosphate transporter